ncbi:MAG TPA: hypothetical protein VK614_08650 [Allosphingosinicella sp.]|nr:hypothetical protein [Allosphingosinicella sp.]
MRIIALSLCAIAFVASPALAGDPPAGNGGIRTEHHAAFGDRGYREAEDVLAAVIDIRSSKSRYLRRVSEEARHSLGGYSLSEACQAGRRCEFRREFPILAGEKTILRLFFNVRVAEFGRAACNDARPNDSCAISASVQLAGDEVYPHCVGIEPILRAAARHGWRLTPPPSPDDYPPDPRISRYRRADQADLRLVIRRSNDDRCLYMVHILGAARIEAPERR